MITPVRLQLSRSRGFDLQAHSLATNGLPAVNVARPTRWGNPYRVGDTVLVNGRRRLITPEIAVERYRREAHLLPPDMRAALAGRNLACWCRISPCHADVLLELANAPAAALVSSRGLFDRSHEGARNGL